ncbi:MAG: GFA family protein [Chthoniobacterales bacterium]
MFMEINGGCVCGGTRYVLRSPPSALADCHCVDCRRSAGAPYVQWGSVPRQDLIVTKGEPRKIAYANRIRSFAACCGTHLFFEDSTDSDTIDFTIASLDDPTLFAPQKTIFLEDKLPWIVINESIPSFRTIPKKKPND